jgi:hypothetical protein
MSNCGENFLCRVSVETNKMLDSQSERLVFLRFNRNNPPMKQTQAAATQEQKTMIHHHIKRIIRNAAESVGCSLSDEVCGQIAHEFQSRIMTVVGTENLDRLLGKLKSKKADE